MITLLHNIIINDVMYTVDSHDTEDDRRFIWTGLKLIVNCQIICVYKTCQSTFPINSLACCMSQILDVGVWLSLCIGTSYPFNYLMGSYIVLRGVL